MAKDIINTKDAALEEALRAIEKMYGKGSIMKLGEKTDRSHPGCFNRFYRARYRPRNRRPSARTGH